MESRKNLIVSAVAVTTALLITLSVGIGVTQGRINNTVSEKIVYASDSSALTSNYLKQGGQTVVLENWIVGTEDTRTETIVLSANKSLNGTIACSSSSQYVAASLDKSNLKYPIRLDI